MSTPQDPFRSGSSDSPTWGPAEGSPGYGPAPQSYGPAPQSYGQVPTYGGQSGPEKTSSTAIVALVLAVGSFVVFPLIPAIVALVLVPRAREEIELSGGRVGGDGLLTATKVVAWINIGLCVAGVLLLIAAFSLFATVGFS